jgi:Ca2+-binding EF-hand superfamily protein
LRAIFQQIDFSGAGEINGSDMCVAFQKLGQDISLERVSEMLKASDCKDGKMNFEEFREIFKKI